MKYHRLHNSKPNTRISLFYRNYSRIAIKAKDVTDVLRHAMTINYYCTGIHTSEISARSLQAWGANAILCWKIDVQNIRMMGRWRSDAMMQYLQIQAALVLKKYAAKICNEDTYTFQPDKTVPIIDVYDNVYSRPRCNLTIPSITKRLMRSMPEATPPI
jgi:hypothetical protein